MNLQDVLNTLHIPEAVELYAPHWDETQGRLSEGALPHLEEGRVIENARWAGLDEEIHPALVEMARHIQDSEALRRLWWHCHCLIYDYEGDYPNQYFSKWPTLEAALGEERYPLFHLLLTCACVPMAVAWHREHGIPEEITRSTCSDVDHKVLEYRMFNDGQWGTARRSLYWFRHHAAGRLFEVGRFQYKVQGAREGQRVFRHRASGKTILLANDGIAFTVDGLRPGGDDDPKPVAWTSHYREEGDRYIGAPIHPAGRAENREVALAKGEWECVLAPGDPIMDMHIPAGGRMTLEASKASFEDGMAFFSKHLPDRPFKAIMCGSWIFSPNLEEFLAPEANLVKLEREVYLCPIPSTPVGGLVFVFGEPEVDYATASRATSLQRAILDHLIAGGEMRLGGMVIMAEDVAKMGAQFYRSNYPLEGEV